jgi:hypothetical protein
LEKIKNETAYDKLKPFIRPKWAFYLGVLFMGLSQIKEVFSGMGIGAMIGLLGAPLNRDYMKTNYPNTGK